MSRCARGISCSPETQIPDRSGFPSAVRGAAGFSITASSLSLSTNGQLALHAELPSGEPAAVTWSIASGDNAAALGQGQIDASGLYTAPGSISSDNVPVRIEAALQPKPLPSGAELAPPVRAPRRPAPPRNDLIIGFSATVTF